MADRAIVRLVDVTTTERRSTSSHATDVRERQIEA
jgi:hypothetical protein